VRDEPDIVGLERRDDGVAPGHFGLDHDSLHLSGYD
jgi:hypothetical protein